MQRFGRNRAAIEFEGARDTHARSFAITVLLGASLLAGCGSKPRPPPETHLTVQIVAGADTNPDRSGRPSPVGLTMVQLKAPDAFLNADFFTASNPTSPALMTDVAGREEMTLQPGETREWKVKMDPAAAHLGVIAAFRDIEHATWRAEMALPPLPKGASGPQYVQLVVRVDALKVSIAAAETKKH